VWSGLEVLAANKLTMNLKMVDRYFLRRVPGFIVEGYLQQQFTW
jgi:hypothetical protein